MTSRNPLGLNLEQYRSDFESVTGKPFKHFFCPILRVDEDVRLTKGHIVPASLGGQQRVMQRADVDNGFGSFFEAESADAMTKGLQQDNLVERVLSDSAGLQRFSQWLELEGKERRVPVKSRQVGNEKIFFVPKSDLQADGKTFKARFAVELDARSSMLITCLKASYLYWFKQLGYSYVFSNEGIFVASVLARAYRKFIQPRQRPNRKKPGLMSEKVKTKVNEFCLQFANFLRPVPQETVNSWPPELQKGTVDSGWFLALVDEGELYGRITVLKFGKEYSAIMTPMITDARGWALLDLAANLQLEFTVARWNADIAQYEIAPPSGNSLIWPSAKNQTRRISIHEAAKLVLASGRLKDA